MDLDFHDQVNEISETESQSYVLITCSSPGENGELKVEMSYRGDRQLIAFLLNDAINRMEAEEEESHLSLL